MTQDDRTTGLGGIGREGTTSRRTFLRAAAAAGTLSAGVGAGAGVVGAQADPGIPTPRLGREDNALVDPQGNEVVLRGVTVADPARLNSNQRYNVTAEQVVGWALDESDGWYNRVIRLPCQTGDIAGDQMDDAEPGTITRSQIESYVADHLRPVVDQIGEHGAYCIVDYHRDASESLFPGTTYTDPALDEEVRLFWDVVAAEFAEDEHVLYELMSEPTAPYHGSDQSRAKLDVTDPDAREYWETWKETAQPWVDAIRERAPETVVIVGSPRRSQYTYWAAEDEFAGDNLAYSGHAYGHQSVRPLSEYFGTPAESVPVFMTEVGFDEDGPDRFDGTTDVEGQEFVDFFEEYDVSFTVYSFDERWEPAMFEGEQGEWTVLSGESYHGQFFKDYLAEKRDADLPGGGETTPEPEGPPPVGDNENAPTDPDGDGLYEDVNGNGGGDLADSVDLFQHREADEVTSNAEAYDFSGNDEVDLADVVQLFQENAG